jgi:hypothetical protein
MDSIENPDRSLESEIYLADSDGNNFKMILGEKRSNLATPLYPFWKNASLSIQYYFFCLRSYIGSDAYYGNANDIITIPFDRDKTNIT